MAWLAALRDHPQRPPVTQRMVLDCLALRMDWSTGCGFVSTGTLAADADCGERTVKNATRWGREHEMLVRTRRGHRTGDGSTVASEWRLALPQQVTGDPLNGISTGTDLPVETASRGKRSHLNGQMEPSQGARTAPPSRPSSSRTRSSANGDGAKAPRPPFATCDRDGPGAHSERCRAGDGPRCGHEWCQCRCHGRQLAETVTR